MNGRSSVLGVASLGAAAVLGLVGRGGVLARRGEPPPAPEVRVTVGDARGTSTAPADSARTRPFRTGADLLASFLGAPLDEAAVAEDSVPYQLNALIATLPDPIDSRSDWAYDAGLESIRRAFERAGYVTDRFWLPWPAQDSGRAAATPNALPTRALHPGVLLFRPSQPTGRTLWLVYVVGEVPTAGVHKAALREALDEQRALARRPAFAAAPADTVLRIVGPMFSGSALSLRRVLTRWRDSSGFRGTVRMVSGAATSSANLATLDDPAAGLSFAATVHSDETLQRAVDSVITRRLGIAPWQIAYLREATTQYGQLSVAAAPAPDGAPMVIPFPMNVSTLRAEYARHPVTLPSTDQQQPQLPGRAAAPRIPLNLQESISPAESPTVVSDLTPPAIDIAMGEIERSLRAHDIRAVGIVATDVRDQLFLADEVKKRLRDVQLFFYGSNALYLREEYNESLRGALVFSTYPLVLENQFWDLTQPDRQRFAFTSEPAVGMYNATLFQLGGERDLVEYDLPNDHRLLRRPPVWVTVVGRDAFYPVTTWEPSDAARAEATRYVAGRSNASLGKRQVAERQRSYLEFGAFMVLLVTGFVLAFATLQFWTAQRVRATEQGWLRPANVQPGTRAEHDALRRNVLRASLLLHREMYVFLRFLALCGALLPAMLLVLRPNAHGSGVPALVLVVCTAAVAAVALVVIRRSGRQAWSVARWTARDGMRYALHPGWGSRAHQALWLLEVLARSVILVVGLGYAALVAHFVYHVVTLAPPASSLFFQRAVSMGSGVSPVTPLILSALGFVSWCSWHLVRISLLAETTVYEEYCLSAAAGAVASAPVLRSHAEAERSSAAPVPQPGWRRLAARVGALDRAFDAALDRMHRRAERATPAQVAVASVRQHLLMLIPGPRGALLIAMLLLLTTWLSTRFQYSMEAAVLPALPFSCCMTSFDLLLRFGVMATIVATSWSLYRFLAVWSALRTCLRAWGEPPLLAAFTQLPASLARLTRLTPFGVGAAATIDRAIDDRWVQLRRIYTDNLVTLDSPTVAEVIGACDTCPPVRGATMYAIDPARGTQFGVLLRALTEARTVPRLAELWIAAVSQLVALYVAEYVEWVFRHLRFMAAFLLVSLVLTVVLLSAYPFEPESAVRVIYLGILGGTVLVLLVVLFQMNRDATLSAIAGTEPGKVSWNAPFVVNLLLYAAVPVVALLSSEFPAVGRFLFSWVSPALHVLAGG